MSLTVDFTMPVFTPVTGADIVINASTQDVTTEDGFRAIISIRLWMGRCCVLLEIPL